MPPDIFSVVIAAAALGWAAVFHRWVRSQPPTLPPDLRGEEIEPHEVRAGRGWQPVAGSDRELAIRLRTASRVDLSEGEVPLTVVEVKGSVRRRLTGGEPGQLSMTGEADGAVSLAVDERGRVSDPEEPAG
jgi:hypothetical protein